ncbi:MAG: alpha/beta fold hydrolase [Wenzhouxiangella sp.]|jgi:homoserine O-acetyltransferase|nr:alpha/beta fold hydrolase [Wenzhouxiangella sp.]
MTATAAARPPSAVLDHPSIHSASARPGPILLDDTLRWPSTDRHGQSRYLNLRFRLHGQLNGPLRIVLGGVSASRQVHCWWRAHYGSGEVLDPGSALILSMDWLDHPTGIDTRDQADALARILDHLDLASVDDLIGASYGAMVGLAFAQRHGHRLRRLIAISGAHCSRPAAQAQRLIQRAILAMGEELGDPERGVRWARALALTGYRPLDLFDERFSDPDPCKALDSLDRYLGHQGRTYSSNVSAARHRCLSESIDAHSVQPELIRCPVELIGVDSDTLVTLNQLRLLRDRLSGRARLHVISSPYGHDSFLKENNKLKDILSGLIKSGSGREAGHA